MRNPYFDHELAVATSVSRDYISFDTVFLSETITNKLLNIYILIG